VSATEITGHYIDVAGTRTHYEELGEGTPIVLIHTLHGCSLQWHQAMPLLAARGYRAIAIDLPGNSRTFPPNLIPINSPHAMAEFVYSFIQTLLPGQKPIVSGTSIGGNITIDLVLHHGADFLAAVAMEGAVYTPTVGPLHGLEAHSSMPSWQDWVERCVLESLGPGVTEEQREEFRWQHRFTSHRASIGEAACWTDQDLRDQAGPVDCPLLVLAGEYDFYMPRELLELTGKLIPNCETKYLDGIGHYPHYEDPQRTVGIIDDFVKAKAAVDV
jgi:pimeloyl-ACP methyl ester carboxylesterase